MEIANIIKDNMIDNTDIIFVLDKTGSMSDAIDNINIGLKQIMIFLQKHENIRLEKATYGDKNVDGNVWYDFNNYEMDHEQINRFIERIQVTEGGDFPESVYDGICEAF
ncbi:MAG: VWA domain-containing protein [Bacteroidetes bacterium]|jgi:hypothetical protein|nr:VWA domain-containing protein [Bacteroidota bacterium]